MDDAGVKAGSAIEAALEKRLQGIYAAALEKAVRNQRAFLQKIKQVDEGKIKPPRTYDTPEKILRWRQGFTRELMRQQGVIQGIADDLTAVGGEVAEEIRGAMADVYGANREYAVAAISEGAGTLVDFAQVDKRQMGVLTREKETPFTKLAYRNLGSNRAVVRRLTNELSQATLLGESQEDILRRIRKVTGQSLWQARRVAQTERTRVQSEARYDAQQEAAQAGIAMQKRWSTRMRRSRDSHIAMDGQVVGQDEPFVSGAGNLLRFPGDPEAPASEVINCRCVMVPVVGVPSGEKNNTMGMPSEKKDKTMALPSKKNNDTMTLPDIQIYRSLGARAMNYDVLDLQTGERFRFVEGTRLRNVEVFAGKGSRTPYRNAYKYAEREGGKPEDWQHVKGVGTLATDDGDRDAEVHWSQCEGIGKFDFNVKRWFDEG